MNDYSLFPSPSSQDNPTVNHQRGILAAFRPETAFTGSATTLERAGIIYYRQPGSTCSWLLGIIRRVFQPSWPVLSSRLPPGIGGDEYSRIRTCNGGYSPTTRLAIESYGGVIITSLAAFHLRPCTQ